MVGGEDSDYEIAKPVFESYSKFSKLLGPAGSGQLAKMVNQVCIAGIVQGLAEGLNFAQKAGLDGEALIEHLKGAAGLANGTIATKRCLMTTSNLGLR